jgi:hypothetical protein
MASTIRRKRSCSAASLGGVCARDGDIESACRLAIAFASALNRLLIRECR